jgi:single-stranded-DNA-specific exonuclease
MVLKAAGNDRLFDAIAFNYGERRVSRETPQIRVAYRLDVNEFRGQRSAQLLVEHIEID